MRSSVNWRSKNWNIRRGSTWWGGGVPSPRPALLGCELHSPQTSLAGKSGALLGSPRLGAGLNRGYRAPSSGGLEVCGCSAGAKGQS